MGLVLPFVVRSTLAAGVMQASGARGVEIVICLGDGFVTVTVPEGDAPTAPPSERDDRMPCRWDEAALTVLPAAPTTVGVAPTALRPATWSPPARMADIRALTRRIANRGLPVPV